MKIHTNLNDTKIVLCIGCGVIMNDNYFFSGKNERKQFLKEFCETQVEGSEDLINYDYEHG